MRLTKRKTIAASAAALMGALLKRQNMRYSLLLAAAGLALATCASQADAATRVLFVGNSFTHGNFEPTLHYNAANVHDLNGGGIGGVPGIFKKMTDEAGLSYDVSIEAVSGQSLQYHYANKLAQIGSASFDVVALQDYSTLDVNNPGNPGELYNYSKLLEQFIHGANNPNANPNARVYLTATWARADQVYNTPGGLWNGTSVEKMTGDLHAAYYEAWAQDARIAGVNPVGDAFLLAITSGVADRNPYDGIDSGKVDLWNVDNYHASAWGSYLEALTLLDKITGRDPRTLGYDAAAVGLGVSSTQATALQNIAYQAVASGMIAGTHSIINVANGLAIDNAGSTTQNTGVLQWGSNGQNQQKWSFTQNSDTSWCIVNRLSGQALDNAGSTTNGTQIIQWPLNAANVNQRWWVDVQSDGTYKIWSKMSSQSLDDDNMTTNGAPLIQWPVAANNNNQRWRIQ